MTARKDVLGSLHKATEAGRVAEEAVGRSNSLVELIHEITVDLEKCMLFGDLTRASESLLKFLVDIRHGFFDVVSPS